MTRRALRLSRWALLAERLAEAFWPAFTALCLTLAAALLGLFEALPAAYHGYALVAAGAVLLGTLGWGLWRFRPPRRAEAAARLDAPDPAHPLATLADSLFAGRDDAVSRQLWFEHLRRAERAAERLRPVPPRPDLARRDPWALRLFAPTLLLAALIGAGSTWPDRLASLTHPARAAGDGPLAGAAEPAVLAWAIPPAYTGLPTIEIDRLAREGREIRVPVGAELVVRVSDLGALPEIEAPGVALAGDGFSDFGGVLAEARGTLSASGPIEVRGRGRVLAHWKVAVIPDAPPEIAFTARPGAAITGALEVPFEARDDYGVTAAWVEIVPWGGLEAGRGLIEEPIVFALPLPLSGRALEVRERAMRDLSEHPWAGGWVKLTIHGEDGAGQRASAGPVGLRLPGRNFSEPLARALVEERRALALEFAAAETVLDRLQAAIRRPEGIFGEHFGAYLGTRRVLRRLAFALVDEKVPEAAPEVVELLWLAALSIEAGDLASALERLRAAEEKLRRALQEGSEEDIRRAMDELRQAMRDYLEEMVRQALERGIEQQQGPQPGDQQMLSQQDLEELLDELQRQAEAGLREQAQNLLDQLAQMLENLRAGEMRAGGGEQQSLEALQELIQRQRDLSDRTFDELRRQRRQGETEGGQTGPFGEFQPGEEGQGRGQGRDQSEHGRLGGLAREQEALRRLLDELMRQLPGGAEGPIREALEGAERSMGAARDDLEQGRPGDALPDQLDALERLGEGTRALAEELRRGQGDVANRGRGTREGRAQDELDPFDRPLGAWGAIDGRDTRVPDRSAIDRARRLLEELRRRAGEAWRPELEREYLDRLLDQF